MPDPTFMTKVRLFGTLMRNVAERSKTNRMKSVMDDVQTAKKRKKYGLYLVDLGVKAWFTFNKKGEMDWGLSYKGIGKDIDTEVFTTFDTLMCLKIGTIKVEMDDRSQRAYPFTFYDAWKLDRIKFTGEGSTVDVKRFTDILKAHPEVLDKLVK